MRNRVRHVWWILAVPAGITLFALHKYTDMFGWALSRSHEIWGQFGDFLGGVVNPVVGLVTIVLLIFTLQSQQRELAEQRSQAAIQGFEQTFTSWLTAYREAVYQTDFIKRAGQQESRLIGLRALEAIVKSQHLPTPAQFYASVSPPSFSSESQIQRIIRTASLPLRPIRWWEDVYKENEPHLAMLLRTLYTLIRSIDEHEAISWQQKWDYVSILRARMSTPELIVLFFNKTTKRGERFTDYVERYALLDNMPLDSHIYVKLMIELENHGFSEMAFSSQTAREKLLKDPSSQRSISALRASKSAAPGATGHPSA